MSAKPEIRPVYNDAGHGPCAKCGAVVGRIGYRADGARAVICYRCASEKREGERVGK